ncbi:hypothetical protein BDW59DRAFT_165762 [Aspergillus cavernicola]|uniref:AB hydrolase-1 domain-containing protein n=1 Tax=Aspergillus cavernicola TaxID=176166 RepID=A0ABR4HR24_9EURO
MASNQGKLGVVICHGFFHTPAPYEPLMRTLNSPGFETYCHQRPTADLSKLNAGDVNNPGFDRGPSPEGFPSDFDDVAVIQQVLDKLINQESKQVLLLAHSSSSWAATQAAIPELQCKTVKKEAWLFYSTTSPSFNTLFMYILCSAQLTKLLVVCK